MVSRLFKKEQHASQRDLCISESRMYFLVDQFLTATEFLISLVKNSFWPKVLEDQLWIQVL